MTPPPGYCDPALEPYRERLAEWLDRADPAPVHYSTPIEDPYEASDQVTIRRMKWLAPAPYVGPRFVYWWWVGVTEGSGLHIASTEVHRLGMPEWPP